MLKIFQDLLLLKKVKIEEGKFTLLGQRVCVAPIETLGSMTGLSLKNNTASSLYEAVRTSFSSGWAEASKREFNFKPQDYFKWLIDLAHLNGWGNNELVEFNIDAREGTIKVSNGPISEWFKGKTDSPVDHVYRGLIAGGLSTSFKMDIDVIETKCAAKGDSYCLFVFKPRSKFKNPPAELSEFVKKQLPDIA